MSTISHDSETPAHGQQVITACAFIHREVDGVHKVFLPKRAHTKKFLPNVYELPGGHIDFGENPVAGLQREIEEELGMQARIGDPFGVFTYTNEVKGSHSIEVVYFACFTSPLEQLTLHPEDHATAGWFTEDEAAALMPAGDEETRVLHKGFALLRGEQLKHF
jgi:8-oxo-dGTP pyrophosphatase MutT (NUDIX family)